MEQTSVLIAGAGPTGLMLGAHLARFGVDFRIIDPKRGPTRESRALAVQARSLEAYQQIGLAERAVADGEIMSGMNFFAGGKLRRRIPLGDIGKELSPYPFVLILEQSKNESLLSTHLSDRGQTIDWGWELRHLESDADGVSVFAQDADGAERTYRADYVVGADGASSAVRHALGLEFPGGTYNQLFFVADLRIEGDIPETEGSIFFSKSHFALIFPMAGQRHFRLVGIAPRTETGDAPSFEAVRETSLAALPPGTRLDTPNWFSTYVVHHRSVQSFCEGRIMLAGDAAHVHSPAGGQGMNTGLLDAQNLAWKLAMVVKQQARPTLLDTYHDERWTFAQRLLATTDRAFQAATSPALGPRLLREHVLPNVLALGLRINRVRRFLFGTVSQTGIEYQNSSLSSGGALGPLLAAGDRFPWIDLKLANGQVKSSFDLFADPGWTALSFSSSGTAQSKLTSSLADLQKSLSISVYGHVVQAADETWNRALAGRVVLVRPDTYVGHIGRDISARALTAYFRDHVVG